MLSLLGNLPGLHHIIAVFLVLAVWPACRLRLLPAPVAIGAGAILGAIILFMFWVSARSHPNAAAGLIPWNDAAGYLGCARQLVAGAEIDVGCSMRPYYSAFFGVILGAAGGYFQIALMMQAALLGGVSAWFSHAVARHYGVGSGLVCFSLLVVYNASFTMPVMTEAAGLSLGLLALALLLLRDEGVSRFDFLVAMMVLTLALTARAGPILVIPFLILCAAARTAGGLRAKCLVAGAGLCGVIVAIAANFILIETLGGSVARSQSNLAYTLYAMSTNSATYLQILIDYPELRQMPAEQFTQVAFQKTWSNIAENPENFIMAYVRGGMSWIYNWFDYVQLFQLRAVFFVLWVIGFLSCLLRRQDDREFLLLTAFAGVALSAPFLYPFGGSRILAATLPLDLMFIAIGTVQLVKPTIGLQSGSGWIRQAWVIAVIAVLPIMAAPIFRQLPVLHRSGLDASCPEEQIPLIAELGRESVGVGLIEKASSSLFPLEVQQAQFVARLPMEIAHREHLAATAAGISIIDAMQRFSGADTGLRYGRSIQFLWEGPVPQGMIQACIMPGAMEWLPSLTRLSGGNGS